MNLLVVGVSYRTGPVRLLERVAVAPREVPGLLEALLARPYVGEAALLSTCNRVEVYAGASTFHGGLAEVGAVLAERAGVELSELAEHLYVRYDEDAVRHAFRVAAGLDSMVVGESQILGQMRQAYTVAVEQGGPGALLHELMQQALRVGKRVHAETSIDRAGQSVVSAALSLGEQQLGPVVGRSALVVGAGAMGSLALATLRRAEAGELVVANRGTARAARLADKYEARSVHLDALAAELARVDIVVSATASTGYLLSRDTLAAAVAARNGRPLLVLDLAVPRDVEPAAAEVPGVVLVDIEQLGVALGDAWVVPDSTGLSAVVGDVDAAERIVADEVEAFLGWLRSTEVAPTVAALRGRAEDVVAGELRRLTQRRPELTEAQRGEIARTLHRVVQQLLHSPTVRVRQLASEPGGDRYAKALRELFDLDVTEASAAAVLAADEAVSARQAAGRATFAELAALAADPATVADQVVLTQRSARTTEPAEPGEAGA